MGAEEKYSAILDLLARAKDGELLDLALLGDEIRKGLDSGDKTFSIFNDLVESLQDIIPKEKQRYNAALKALSKTSGLNRQHILESAESRIGELKDIEGLVFSAMAGFSDALHALAARSKLIRSEIAELRKKISDLEKEEQETLSSLARRERENKAAEQAVRKVFSDVGAEITEISNKIVQFSAEAAPTQPIKPPASVEPAEREDAEADVELEESPAEEPAAPQDTKWIKKCPLCGGQMNFHSSESLWMCYTCGNEEPEKNAGSGAGGPAAAAAAANPPEPAPPDESAAELDPAPAAKPPVPPEPAPPAKPAPAPKNKPTPAAAQPSGKQSFPGKKKACPVCRKQMNMHEEENTWKCPFCNYQRREF